MMSLLRHCHVPAGSRCAAPEISTHARIDVKFAIRIIKMNATDIKLTESV